MFKTPAGKLMIQCKIITLHFRLYPLKRDIKNNKKTIKRKKNYKTKVGEFGNIQGKRNQ